VQLLGLEPVGDSLYLQRVPLVREVLARTTRLAVISSGGREQLLSVPQDVTPQLGFSEGQPHPNRTAEGEIVFVGYGPTDDASQAAMARLDLAGKVVVAVHGVPKKKSREDHAPILSSHEALNEEFARLLAFRPAAIITLMTDDLRSTYEGTAAMLLHRIVSDRPEAPVDSTRQIPLVLIGQARRGSPLLPRDWPNDNTPQALGRRLEANVDVERQPFTGYNVVALVRGSDPKLNRTYLAFGANYDGWGITPALRGPSRRQAVDSIENGANNNGSGSVALLAIARQTTYWRPKRSVLFVWHVAHDQGSLGARYFTAHPPFPIDSIVAEFNLEGVAGTVSDGLAMVGPRAAPNYLSWRVGMIVDSVNFASATPLRIEREWDDPEAPRVYEHGDHLSYAEHRIPTLFFASQCESKTSGLYDEPRLIDYDRLARVSQLLLESGLAVANRSTRPTSEAITQSISSRQE